MSRTDKTDPFWVRINTGYYASEPVHRHETSECNLPPRREWTGWGGSGRDDCYWTFVYTGRNVCACKMCSSWKLWSQATSPRRSRRNARLDSLRWKGEFNASGGMDEWWDV